MITTVVIPKQELPTRKMPTMIPLRLSVQVLGVLKIERLSPSLLGEAGIETGATVLCAWIYNTTQKASVVAGSHRSGRFPKAP